MKTKYFNKLDDAKIVMRLFAGQEFPNRFQVPGECKKAQIRKFQKPGKPVQYAIQFGDCGPYYPEIPKV